MTNHLRVIIWQEMQILIKLTALVGRAQIENSCQGIKNYFRFFGLKPFRRKKSDGCICPKISKVTAFCTRRRRLVLPKLSAVAFMKCQKQWRQCTKDKDQICVTIWLPQTFIFFYFMDHGSWIMDQAFCEF